MLGKRYELSASADKSPRRKDREKCVRCHTGQVQSSSKYQSIRHEGKPLLMLKASSVIKRPNLESRFRWAGINAFNSSQQVISPTKTTEEIGSRQRAGWSRLHNVEPAFASEVGRFSGPAEINEAETMKGAKTLPNLVRDEPSKQRPIGKSATRVATDSKTKGNAAKTVQSGDKANPPWFIRGYAAHWASLLLGGALDYETATPTNAAMKRSTTKYVGGRVRFDCVESFWLMVERCCLGTIRTMLSEHTQHCGKERKGWHSPHESDPVEWMSETPDEIHGTGLLNNGFVRGNWLSCGMGGSTIVIP